MPGGPTRAGQTAVVAAARGNVADGTDSSVDADLLSEVATRFVAYDALADGYAPDDVPRAAICIEKVQRCVELGVSRAGSRRVHRA